MQNKEWQRFFKAEADVYLANVFTRNTVAEVDFIIYELKLEPGESILDVGCGTGRHSLELARRGYSCTGIDQSQEMLAVGRKIAEEEGLHVEFFQGDAATTRLDRTFDHAICLCEGAFSLLEVDTDPVHYHQGILDNLASMLRSGGGFLLTALNGFRMIREHDDADVADGHFDVMAVAHTEELPIGSAETVSVVEKGFLPAELRSLLEQAGFRVLSIWGGTAGSWNKRPIKLDEIEIMMVAKRE